MNSAATDAHPKMVGGQKKTKKQFSYNPNRVAHTLDKLGLGYFSPIARLIGRDEPAKQIREIAMNTFLPVAAIILFIGVWAACAKTVQTDSVKIPSPSETWVAFAGSAGAPPSEDAKSILGFVRAEKVKEIEFRGKNQKRIEKFEAKARDAAAAGDTAKAEKFEAMAEKFRSKKYQGNKTFFDQIAISLLTVSIGFIAATLIAVPIGILCGISKPVNVPAHPTVQASLSTRLVPHRFCFHHMGNRQARGRQHLAAGALQLCGRRHTLLSVADTDEHGRRRCRRRQRPPQRGQSPQTQLA